MKIPDLTEFPPDHHPSPYGFPLPLLSGEKWGIGHLPEGSTLVAVGWLGNSVTSKGSVEKDVLDALLEAYESNAVFSDGTAGWHDCELCPGPEAWYSDGKIGPLICWRGRQIRLYGHGHHLLRHGSIVYMVPALILHYILDHNYRPPEEFLKAVTNGEFLRPDHLRWEAYSPEDPLSAG
jgi:hypothetical protein